MFSVKICNFQRLISNSFAKYEVIRTLSTSPHLCLDQRWRRKKGLPMNPNAYGVLTDTPDYTFMDGRPTPLGVKQGIRLKERQEQAKKIIALSGEIDFAVEYHKKRQLDEMKQRQSIIANKLKPKGDLLNKT